MLRPATGAVKVATREKALLVPAPALVQQLLAAVLLSPTTPLFSLALVTIMPTEIPKRRRVRISPIFLAM